MVDLRKHKLWNTLKYIEISEIVRERPAIDRGSRPERSRCTLAPDVGKCQILAPVLPKMPRTAQDPFDSLDLMRISVPYRLQSVLTLTPGLAAFQIQTHSDTKSSRLIFQSKSKVFSNSIRTPKQCTQIGSTCLVSFRGLSERSKVAFFKICLEPCESS